MANLDELRFFLDGREQLADHVQAIGATVTDLMRAISAEEYAVTAPMPERVDEVRGLLADAPEELSLDDLEIVEA